MSYPCHVCAGTMLPGVTYNIPREYDPTKPSCGKVYHYYQGTAYMGMPSGGTLGNVRILQRHRHGGGAPHVAWPTTEERLTVAHLPRGYRENEQRTRGEEARASRVRRRAIPTYANLGRWESEVLPQPAGDRPCPPDQRRRGCLPLGY
jgi:hypothetical protein